MQQAVCPRNPPTVWLSAPESMNVSPPTKLAVHESPARRSKAHVHAACHEEQQQEVHILHEHAIAERNHDQEGWEEEGLQQLAHCRRSAADIWNPKREAHLAQDRGSVKLLQSPTA